MARSHGLIVSQPVVVRDLSNVLVHLRPAPVVARVATTTAVVREGGAVAWLERDVQVASYLAAAGLPVVPPAGELPPGPHLHDGLAISFWRFVDHDPSRPVEAAQVGALLREVHEALATFPGELRPLRAVLEEIGLVLDHLGAEASLGAHDLGLLRAALARVRPLVTDPWLGAQALHGDAHAGNLLSTPDGPLWTDFEDACSGSPLWDLACLVGAGRLFGPDSERAEAALRAYGVPAEEELAPFVEARALQVAAWTALMAERHPQVRDQADARLAWWRERAD